MRAMNARPILFSGEMVRALLDGRKTQDRRIVRPQPPEGTDALRDIPGENRWWAAYATHDANGVTYRPLGSDQQHSWRCPYGQPGDLLWVRERWTFVNVQRRGDQSELVVAHNADGADLPNRPAIFVHDPDSRWYDAALGWFDRRKRPSNHMPRWASRLTLRITDVRVEQLHDISDEDAIAEGLMTHPNVGGVRCWEGYEGAGVTPSPMVAYRDLWESIHGPGSWDANPWVWVITFETIHVGVQS